MTLCKENPYLHSCCCSVAQPCLTHFHLMNYSMPVLRVPHHLREFAQVYVHCIDGAVQPSHPLTANLSLTLTSSSPSALDLSQRTEDSLENSLVLRKIFILTSFLFTLYLPKVPMSSKNQN